jgi:hypothetical protein
MDFQKVRHVYDIRRTEDSSVPGMINIHTRATNANTHD